MKTLDTNIYQALFTGARDAIFVIEDRHGCLVDANESAADLLGYGSDDLVGKHILDLFPGDQRPAMKDFLRDIWATGGSDGFSCQMMSATGDELVVYCKAQVVSQGDRKFLSIVIPVLADDTSANAELHKVIHQANHHAHQARQATKAKNRMIANLTHELRTPLNALIGMSGLLTDMEMTAEPREAVEMVADSAKGLMCLVNDVLDFAKIEAGKMELRREPFPLNGLLRGITETFALQVKEKELRYELKVDRKISTWLVGDEGRLRQVLINLVGNALKFTEEGGVTIEVSQESLEGQNIRLKFGVTDTGCGIAEDAQAHLFEAFTQADSPGTTHLAGTGLGLTISRQLVDMMGGEIGVTSQDGWGSTFEFTARLQVGEPPAKDTELPKTEIKATVARAMPAPADGLPGELHVLLVEDNKVNQTVALGMMRKLGITGVAADNGEHALEVLAGESFDMVFMDLQMPKLGGLEATRQIRAGAAGDRNQDIPIIAMTGHATRQDRQACLNAGMNGYIAKPICSERIHESILKLSAGEVEVDGRGEPFAMAKLVSQMNGDTELAAEILEIFRSDTDERLRRIAQDVRNYDFEKAGHEARAIEGGALNVCAEIMVNLAGELHRAVQNKEQEYAASVIEEMTEELAVMVTES